MVCVYLALQNERSPSGLENVASYGVMVSRFFMARLGARAAYNPALFSSSCCGPDTMRCRLDAQKKRGRREYIPLSLIFARRDWKWEMPGGNCGNLNALGRNWRTDLSLETFWADTRKWSKIWKSFSPCFDFCVRPVITRRIEKKPPQRTFKRLEEGYMASSFRTARIPSSEGRE